MRIRSALFSAVFCSFTLFLNIASIALLAYRKPSKAAKHDPQTKLLIFTVTVFIALLILGIEQVTEFILNKTYHSHFRFVFPSVPITSSLIPLSNGISPNTRTG